MMSWCVRFSGSARSMNSRRLCRSALGMISSSIFAQMRLMCGSIVQFTIPMSCEPSISSFSRCVPTADQVVPVHFLEGLVLAEHQLAVVELQRVGVARLAD